MKKRKENLFLILLAAAVLIVGFVAVYLSRVPAELAKPDTQTQRLSTQSPSDEISALEKDILDTDLSDIDKELQDIEAELSGI